MERSFKKNGLINFLVLLVVGVAAFAVARSVNSLAGQVCALFLGLGMLVAAVSWFQMRLEESERLEKLEFDELAKSHDASALFEGKDADGFPAQRSREQFERFFVPGFTVLLCVLEGAGGVFFWRWLSAPTTKIQMTQPMTALALFAVFALVLFMLGRFAATFARLERDRLLRPGASHLLLDAFLCALVAAGIVGTQIEAPRADYFLARLLCALLALLAAETLVALVLEIYRPRVKGKIERPMYDSRLVGLLGQPEGLVSTAAQALDYQFGFKVSETWFYRLFFERALKWFVLAQVGILILSTCFVFIETGQQAVLEHFGKRVDGRNPLGPGGHLIWPWPIDTVYRYRTEQIQCFEIGLPRGGEEAPEPGRVILWTVSHTGKQEEDNFLVANREQTASEPTDESGARRAPPVSLLTGTLPVQYQITDLLEWHYENKDAAALLQDLARREVVRYFVSADLSEVLSEGALAASRALAERIQAEVDKHHLGARIVSVGLQDLHPPVKVAPDFEKVIAAMQTREATILGARADEIKTNALAQIEATNILSEALAYRTTREIGALAQAALFTNQIPAFQAAPSVYAQRLYLEAFQRAIAGARKYLLLTTNTHDVLIFDLQESFTRDLSRLSVPGPSSK